ncbi:MAG: SRPBCC domain-containing protein [Acidimicrobiaceae bacterium]|nr:SRPBCC domain-containing protein [Acidimicrobiaceae bacterium]
MGRVHHRRVDRSQVHRSQVHRNGVIDQIEIGAPPERVWEVFTDFPAFPTWNPFITALEGKLEPGRRLRVTLRLGSRLVRLRPEVTVVRPAREIRWLVRQPIRGIFDVERVFEFEPLASSGTRFAQWEVGRGLLAPVIMAIVGPMIARGYAALNRSLRMRVEARVEAEP